MRAREHCRREPASTVEGREARDVRDRKRDQPHTTRTRQTSPQPTTPVGSPPTRRRQPVRLTP
ncbi:hypothetical protein GCM10010094_86570 [Streptomyces flaveus]|uniref:Uncharacterized protein n=1 Tax=Streptomyces flaveus TaxID=66370 RepID=A0A917RL98_9ACTN|nr:hypothetical protein GCM10010094_86570 [Streptomyces flaveus]